MPTANPRRAFQLISYDQVTEKLALTDGGKARLQAVTSPLKVVVVVGAMRAGKSALLNLLIGQAVFKARTSIASCAFAVLCCR